LGKLIGGLLTSSESMTLAATSTMPLTGGCALAGYSGKGYAACQRLAET
jgi:hypothetical protein